MNMYNRFTNLMIIHFNGSETSSTLKSLLLNYGTLVVVEHHQFPFRSMRLLTILALIVYKTFI